VSETVNHPRATVAEAIAAWEAKGPTSLTAALMSEALYGVREVCDQVEANPVGWGGAPVVSLARTLRTRPTAHPAPAPVGTQTREGEDRG
jgi:hypothetical protein